MLGRILSISALISTAAYTCYLKPYKNVSHGHVVFLTQWTNLPEEIRKAHLFCNQTVQSNEQFAPASLLLPTAFKRSVKMATVTVDLLTSTHGKKAPEKYPGEVSLGHIFRCLNELDARRSQRRGVDCTFQLCTYAHVCTTSPWEKKTKQGKGIPWLDCCYHLDS